MSSSGSCADLVERCGGALFEFGVGPGANLEATEALVGHLECGGEDGDRDPIC